MQFRSGIKECTSFVKQQQLQDPNNMYNGILALSCVATKSRKALFWMVNGLTEQLSPSGAMPDKALEQ
jgi:hypothetical protein